MDYQETTGITSSKINLDFARDKIVNKWDPGLEGIWEQIELCRLMRRCAGEAGPCVMARVWCWQLWGRVSVPSPVMVSIEGTCVFTDKLQAGPVSE